MIYVILPSNMSMDTYPNNKIFQANSPETLQVDSGIEKWKFSFLIYGTMWEKTNIFLLICTILL